MKPGPAFTSKPIATRRKAQMVCPTKGIERKRQRFMKIDHHIHTSRYSPDSSIDPAELLEHACEIGLDGIVITEHDYQWQADELAELAARAPSLRVFSGAEISAREGHFLVYGLPSLEETPPGIL